MHFNQCRSNSSTPLTAKTDRVESSADTRACIAYLRVGVADRASPEGTADRELLLLLLLKKLVMKGWERAINTLSVQRP